LPINRERQIRKKVGLFGGTFNPIHIGHLRGAEEVREAFQLSTIIFIPSAIPPHKNASGIIDANHRLEMVKRAISKNPYFITNDIELRRPGKSYTIDTLKFFKENSNDILYFILGSDAFVEIETWKDFKNLFSLSNFIVMTRPGMEKEDLLPPASLRDMFIYDQKLRAWKHQSGNMLYFQEITFLDISSTKIRELLEKGRSVKYLIPAEVEEYLKGYSLYKIE
jgi:nicotinate-nucleotide adenylyltransferase